MARICRYYPTRTYKRYFKPCDVARIAENCMLDNAGLDPNVLLSCVAKRLGFTHIVLHPEKEDFYADYIRKERELDGMTIEQIKEQERLEKAAEDLPDAISLDNVRDEENFLIRLFEIIKGMLNASNSR